MSRLACGFVAALVFAGCIADENEVDQDVKGDNGLDGAPEHLQYAKGQAGHGGGSPLMTNHGGQVLTAAKMEAIFWGDWSSPGDKVSGLDSFFTGWAGSSVAGASTEYSGSNGRVTTATSYLGHVFDTSTAPRKALSTSSAVAEACAITSNNPDPQAVYFIYTSTGAGHVSYCAWHSYGHCSNGAVVQVAYMPNLDGIAGCDPGDTTTGHSEGLAALVNVTSHELSEAITDPHIDAWYDNGGQENGDKCAWSFDGVHAVGHDQWLYQGEWSNAAYTAGTGYPNLSGQKGCLY